ncbi:Esa1p-associated factor [Tulasnella sp. 427]|nr:Esa1p-associated factor [Tulasnella sp. 427]
MSKGRGNEWSRRHTNRKGGKDEMMRLDAGGLKMKKPGMNLDVPDALKAVLGDDWEAVTKNNLDIDASTPDLKLVPLPRSQTVEGILAEFKEHCASSDRKLPSKESVLPTLIYGLQLYFERSLGVNMWRQNITVQYVVFGEEKTMGEVSGAEHLLRMPVNPPSMIAQTSLNPESVALLREYIMELMNFVMTTKTRFFL